MAIEGSVVDFEKAIAMTGGYGRYQKTLLLMGAPIGLTFSFGVSTMGFVLPAIVCEFSISKEQIGFLYSAIYLGMVPAGILWGSVVDVIGRKRTLAITCGIAGFFEFLTAFSQGYWFLFAFKILAGCATAGVHLAFYVYMSEFVDANYKDAMTMQSGAIASFGYFLLPALAAILIPQEFNWKILDGYYNMNSWKLFLMLSSLSPIIGTVIIIFILQETPKYLLIQGQSEKALILLRQIYARNTGNPPESFPVTELRVDESDVKQQGDLKKNSLAKAVSLAVPLFKYPYLIPALMAFAAQIITMGSYNSVRQYIPTLTMLSLGIGQKKSSNLKKIESTPFCILFETQNIFKSDVKCDQNKIKLDPRIYVATAVIGFAVFSSFYFGKFAVKKFGKVKSFLFAHLLSAAAIFCFPFSTAIFSISILGIYALCMQNCLSIAIGLILSRVPATVRGVAVSLVMISGRIGVVLGNQVIPFISKFSCYGTFWFVAGINLLAIPIMYIYSRQPNPLEEAALASAREGSLNGKNANHQP